MRVLSRPLQISGLASALPERIVTNQEIARCLGGDAEMDKIAARTGVYERRRATPEVTAADLAFVATERLFRATGGTPAAIDFLIFCSESPDYIVPATACTLQDRLQLPTSCAAFDVNLGCTGWVYSLGIAQGMLSAGLGETGLILTADTLGRF